MSKKDDPDRKAVFDTPSGLHVWLPHWENEKVDHTRCRASVDAGRMGPKQCLRKGKLLWRSKNKREFLFCTQHHPSNVERKLNERAKETNARSRLMDTYWKQEEIADRIVNKILKMPESEIPKKLLPLVRRYKRLNGSDT